MQSGRQDSNLPRTGYQTVAWPLDHHRQLGFLPQLPKACPACIDRRQQRPDVVLERVTLWETVCRVDASVTALCARMSEWRPSQKDVASHRLVLKGSDYGVCWSGRIDLWSQLWPVEAGALVRLCHNQARRQVWVLPEERTIAGMTLDARRVTTYRRCLPGTEGAEQREDVNEYVVLLPAPEGVTDDDALAMVWAEARSKTTLKGFGAQYHRWIEGQPLWSQSISGGCRSGRIDVVGMLAVVYADDPLRIVGSGDAKGVEYLPSPTPSPAAQVAVVE